jgi:hypothetical protein
VSMPMSVSISRPVSMHLCVCTLGLCLLLCLQPSLTHAGTYLPQRTLPPQNPREIRAPRPFLHARLDRCIGRCVCLCRVRARRSEIDMSMSTL